MKTETRPNYICEFCGKYYIRKHHAEWHEKHCRFNPANDHKCYQDCAFLHRDRDTCNGELTITCTKKDCTMYGYAAERRRLTNVIENADKRMPIECDDFREMTMNERANQYMSTRARPVKLGDIPW